MTARPSAPDFGRTSSQPRPAAAVFFRTANRPVEIHDHEVERAVAVQVGDRRAPGGHAQLGEVSGVGPGLEPALSAVVEEDGGLREGLVAGVDVGPAAALVVAEQPDQARREVAADRVEIGPAVVVEIGEVRSPPHEGKPDGSGAGGLPGVLEERPLHVAVEAVGLRRRSW